MNTSLITLVTGIAAHTAMAQTLVFTDAFDSGVPDPGWLSTSQGPFIIGEGYLSPYSIGIGSQDLNSPPLDTPFLAYLFHPIEFDPNADYELFSAVRVDDPTNNGSQARAYLGWIDPLTPDYQCCMGVGTVAIPGNPAASPTSAGHNRPRTMSSAWCSPCSTAPPTARPTSTM